MAVRYWMCSFSASTANWRRIGDRSITTRVGVAMRDVVSRHGPATRPELFDAFSSGEDYKELREQLTKGKGLTKTNFKKLLRQAIKENAIGLCVVKKRNKLSIFHTGSHEQVRRTKEITKRTELRSTHSLMNRKNN